MMDENTRYDRLIALAGRYRALADENYARIRALAEALQSGFCAYLNSARPPCVLLVPPQGPFEPKAYGDQAFSVPPEGFRALGPIAFGLAVRVSEGDDWLRIPLSCMKDGETFQVSFGEHGHHRFALPLADQDPTEFFEALYVHVEA
ncbi:MAG: hypothetical protein PVI23_01730, partial [Maricaulaceae bacterium]